MGWNAADRIELLAAVLLAASAWLWDPVLAPAARWLSARPKYCLIGLAALPLLLRFALLGAHPVPVPANYDEFSHLLMADTLLNGRFANPAHPFARFFETFFVLQEPTYSSIYPPGLGFSMALGKLLFGLPWAGVLLTTALFCAACYWMLRAWTTAEWALAGGLLSIAIFGPLSPWMNSYWGGSWTAAAGCLVFGALPRLRAAPNTRAACALAVGLAMHMLSRPAESILLSGAALVWLLPVWRRLSIPLAGVLAAVAVLAAQNHAVTGNWLQSPYLLSQQQYGVPAPFSFQANLTPHRELTPGQQRDYEMQQAFRPPDGDTVEAWLSRLTRRVRSWRFYFLPALYIPLLFFAAAAWRNPPLRFAALTGVSFALGTNFFPAFRYHYVAGIVCILLLAVVEGLRRMPRNAMRWTAALAALHFGFWYSAHFLNERVAAWDVWSGLPHPGSPRTEVARHLGAEPGDLLVFIRYFPGHIFQDEWVWNDAAIDRARVVYARDLGDSENLQMIRYFQGRTPLLLEPDARPPRISAWQPQPPPAPMPKPSAQTRSPFEDVR